MTTLLFLLIGVSVLVGLSQLFLTSELLGRWIGRGGLDVADRVAQDDPLETREQHEEEVRQLVAALRDRASPSSDGWS
jgi:hypothetical protein